MVIGAEHVLGGAAFVFATLAEPGLVVHSDGPGSIVLGELDGSLSDRADGLAAFFNSAGIPAEAVSDIQARLWSKFAFICAQAGMTACTRLSVGSVRSSEPAWVMFRRLVEEVASLAMAEGVVLAANAVDGIMDFADSLAPSSTSSLYTDLIEGRRTELEALHGLAVRRSHAHGLQAPMSEAVYALLAPHSTATA